MRKQTTIPERITEEIYDLNTRIHVEDPLAHTIFQKKLNRYLSQLYEGKEELIILCIGTDRSTGDSLGPLVGSKLQALNPTGAVIYGTLDQPVHAVNLQETIDEIEELYYQPFIIAIDACLGRSESVGYVNIKEGSLQPGTGVNKELPTVGNLHIVGVVNIGGFMEYMVLQNTRLSLVMKIAELISQGIYQEIEKLTSLKPSYNHQLNPFEPLPL